MSVRLTRSGPPKRVGTGSTRKLGVEFYNESLLNPDWGQQIALRPGNALEIAMAFQGLNRQQAETIWRPFLEWLASSSQDFSIVSEPKVLDGPARHFWDPRSLKKVPGLVLTDDRPGAPEANVFWASNLGEAGMVLHGYQSAWIPVSLLQADQQGKLADSLCAAARHWEVLLHFNKGLAGAAPEAIDAAKNTAINPAVLDAFALLICAALEPPAYPGIPGHEPDLAAARENVEMIKKCNERDQEGAAERRLLCGGERFL